MNNINVFFKPTEREIEELKEKILSDKNILSEINLGGVSLLQTAIIHGNLELAKFLIDQGIDINHQDESGSTSLHYCPDYEQIEIAKYILKNNGRLNISDKYGNEPLWTAAYNYKNKDERLTIVKLYLDFGANKFHKNNGNKTPADIAGRYQNLKELFAKSS